MLNKHHFGFHALWIVLVLISQSVTVAQAATDCAAVTEIPSTECEALVALYNSTDGANWADNSGWLETNTPCGWKGVTCSSGHVSQLSLSSNQLTGSIPSQLGNLTKLESLRLNANQLTGSILTEFGNMSGLWYLRLDDNQLTGSIPSQLGNLSNLMYLELYNNELTGSIPSQLGNLINLRELHLYDNELTGSIPSQLGNLSDLWQLDLSDNQLTGSIPTELGNLNKLWSFDLSDNELTGSIPTEFGNLSGLRSILDLSNNQLTGTIPSELANLRDVWLLLNNNQLCGEIPAELKNRSSRLELDNNHLTADDPELIEWLNKRNPNWKDTQTSCSTATLQFKLTTYSVTESDGFITINVIRTGDNNGTVSANYATIDNTAIFGSDYTQTTGTLSWADGDSTDKTITIPIIDDNKFEDIETFTISLTDPVSGENLDNATVIVSDSDLICTIVTEIPSTECDALIALYNSTNGASWADNTKWLRADTPCNWYGVECEEGHVIALKLAFNRLHGSIPAELGNLSHLITLQLGSDHGEPMSEIVQMIYDSCGGDLSCEDSMGIWYFTDLEAVENQLIGSIPPELGNLSLLETLELGVGNLSGSIPPELGNLSQLKSLELHYNSLCGEIPVELKNLSSIHIPSNQWNIHLRLDNNHLTASDSELITWLNSRNPNWKTKQTSCPVATTLQFESTTYNVTENGGQATISVTRSGSGARSVNYATIDDTATAPDDYTQTTGTLTWADGDSADKTITITIIDDGKSEGDETFTIILTDPVSGESLDNATVTITDDDTTIVTLVEFMVMALAENEIIVEWQTATEIHNAGFYLWRATGESWKDGDYSTVIRLTKELIPAKGSFNVYSYIDTDVESGMTYYYGLEDIDLNGQSTVHWDLIDSAMAR